MVSAAGMDLTGSAGLEGKGAMTDFRQLYKASVLEAIQTVDLEKVGQAIELLASARDEGRHIFACGNGGSAKAASHFASDLTKGASFNRQARFLTDSLPTLTAYSNDVGCVLWNGRGTAGGRGM